MRILPTLLALALSAGPALAQGGFLGVGIADPLADDPPGAVIQDVQERTAGHFLGLQAGDVVTAVDGTPVTSAAEFARLIAARLPGSVVDLTVSRDGLESVMSGILGRRPGVSSGLGDPRAPGLAPRFQGGPLPSPLRIESEDWGAEMQLLQQRLDELQRELQGMDLRMPELEGFVMPELPEMPRMDFRMPRLPRMDLAFPEFRIEGLPEAGAGAKVRIRYPESTPQADRQRLLDEAVERYGEDVEVEFEGNGTMIRIEQRMQGAAPRPAVPDAPRPRAEGGGDVEEL